MAGEGDVLISHGGKDRLGEDFARKLRQGEQKFSFFLFVIFAASSRPRCLPKLPSVPPPILKFALVPPPYHAGHAQGVLLPSSSPCSCFSCFTHPLTSSRDRLLQICNTTSRHDKEPVSQEVRAGEGSSEDLGSCSVKRRSNQVVVFINVTSEALSTHSRLTSLIRRGHKRSGEFETSWRLAVDVGVRVLNDGSNVVAK
eukprot:753491-Hanusia_phi.AAC.4